MANNKELTQTQFSELIKTLKTRFEKNMHRHNGITWELVYSALKSSPSKCQVLYEMEKTGGEPDVLRQEKTTGEFVFVDCSPESPAGRRSVCYDKKALAERKENKPWSSAEELAKSIGVKILDEQEYRLLQETGQFDSKTSSWIKTPEEVRKLGGALFADYRYGRVFIYHNGAQSYYASRGFRGLVRV